MKENIAVVMGGYSSESEISMLSGQEVYNYLQKTDYTVYAVIISRNEWYVEVANEKIKIDRSDFSFTLGEQKIVFDAIFNAIHGKPGEDGVFAGYLELLEIPQTSCGQFESALCFNKAECNAVLKTRGVRVPKSIILKKDASFDSNLIIRELGLPLFVKPNRSGSSIGVSKVDTLEDLSAAINKAFEIDSIIVLEVMIKGIEVGCGVSDYSGQCKALACTDIKPKNDYFDYESKYSGQSEEVTPARIDQKVYEEIQATSEFVFESLNLCGPTRVDFIVNDMNEAFLIEVNTFPGMSKESILPRQLSYLNIDPVEFYSKSVANAIKRKK